MIRRLKLSSHCLAGLMIAAIMLVVGGAASGTAAPATACGTIETVEGAKYCYHKFGSNPQYTIWFFHGAGDSEQALAEPNLFSEDIYSKFEARLHQVNVVVISYGLVWLLTDYPGREKVPVNATVDIFNSKIVPFIESKLIESKHNLAKPYVVMGHSMGGFNAATLCAAQPAMWSKCVLVNPLLPSWDPFEKNLLDEFHIDPEPFHILDCMSDLEHLHRCLGTALIKSNFSEEGWRTTRPMVLLNKTTSFPNKTNSLPMVFVTSCKNDALVEFNGPKQWATVAKSKNAGSKWVPVMASCDHFQWPYQRVLDFLAK